MQKKNQEEFKVSEAGARYFLTVVVEEAVENLIPITKFLVLSCHRCILLRKSAQHDKMDRSNTENNYILHIKGWHRIEKR